MLIVVGPVLAQDLPQMHLVPNQGPVQEFAAASADPAFGDRVGPRRQQHLIQMIGTDVCV